MKNASVEEKFGLAIDRFDMLRGVKSVLVGFSGGSDSVTLLDLMSKYGREHGIDVAAAHVNHMIRAEEADRDMHFCEDFCHARGIDLHISRIDVPRLAKERGEGLEEAARRVRYEYFDKLCREHGYDKISTAHTCSDNLETVLFNMARGCGLKGLCGIPAMRDNIIRPLIFCQKSEIEEYCEASNLAFVTDSTNTDTSYSRNRIRHKIVPELAALNPRVAQCVGNMCDTLREDEECLAEIASSHSFSEGRLAIASLPAAIRSRVIIREYEKFSGTSPSRDAVTAISSSIVSCKPRDAISLHGNIRFVRNSDQISFERDLRNPTEPGDIPSELELRPGVNRFGDRVILMCDDKSLQSYENEIRALKNIYKLSIHNTLASGKIVGILKVRSRVAGDRIKYGGMTRNVKKLLCDKKIPQNKRNSVPVICDDEGVALICGFPVCDRLKSDKKSDTINIFCFEGEKMSCKKLTDDIESVLVSEEEIQSAVKRICADIERDHEKTGNSKLLLLCILKGSVVFMGDIMKHLTIPVEIDFMKVSSYGAGTKSSGNINIILDLKRNDFSDTDIIIVEDIIDSGRTLACLTELLKERGAASVKTCTMLDKPSRREVKFEADYVGIEIPDKFVVGYGLDYDELYRTLPFVGILKPEAIH